MDIEVFGSFSREVADEIRQELGDTRVAFQSGFSGERILKIIGATSENQIRRIQAFLLRLLGGDQIGRIVIKRGSIELANVPAKDLDRVRDLVEDLAKFANVTSK